MPFLPIDAPLEAALAAARTPGLTRFLAGITNLGDVWFAVFAAGLIWIFLAMNRSERYAPELFLAVAGSGLTVLALKILVGEPRPLAPIALMTLDSFSFPSGHAAAAASLYGFLMWIAVGSGRLTPPRIAAGGALFALIVLIGFSRLYLGVHYFSDVAAGYVIGFAWLAGCVFLARTRILRRPTRR